MTAVSLYGVSKDFGRHRVLHDVSLDVEAGELLVLLGASGSGKSTTLRLISGLDRVSAGEITLGDRVVSTVHKNVPANKRSLGFVFQSYALWPHLSVRRNVEYPLRARRGRAPLRGRTVEQVRADALRALELVHLDHLADRRIGQLSGGQQQRVALARAIVGEPSLVLFDEPLSNLDAQLRAEMRTEIKRLQRQLGFTAIYVTHDHDEAVALADRIAVFEDGRTVQVDTARTVFTRPATGSVARFVGFDNLLTVSIAAVLGDGRYRVVAAGGPATVSGPAGLEPGDDALLCIRARNVTVHPLHAGNTGSNRSGAVSRVDPAEAVPVDAAVAPDLVYTASGGLAHLSVGGARLVGVLPAVEWSPEPEERLQADGWRARVTVDWSHAHLVAGGRSPAIDADGSGTPSTPRTPVAVPASQRAAS